MKNKIFEKLVKIQFWIGVNVIGIPEFHYHEKRVYKTEITKGYANK